MLLPGDAVLSGPPGSVPSLIAGPVDKAGIINLARPPWKIQYVFTTPAEKLWKISAEVSPGAYTRLTVAAPGPSGRSITAALQAWGGGVGDFTTVDLGFLPLPAGTNALEFKSEMDDLRPLQIRRVWLSPAS